MVDTSDEICGDGIVPHPSVGMARRMMVPSLDQQGEILVEAVQNHTTDVIICFYYRRTSQNRMSIATSWPPQKIPHIKKPRN